MTRDEVLNAAKQCVCHDRNNQYGSPEDNFKTIAYLWTDYLNAGNALRGVGICLRAKDVAVMMILLKVARVATGSGNYADGWIDICGYAACGGEIDGKGRIEKN